MSVSPIFSECLVVLLKALLKKLSTIDVKLIFNFQLRIQKTHHYCYGLVLPCAHYVGINEYKTQHREGKRKK